MNEAGDRSGHRSVDDLEGNGAERQCEGE